MPPVSIASPDNLVRWQRLVDGSSEMTALIETVAACDVTDVTALQRVRDRWEAGIVSTAIELVRARAKARRKFPNMPDIVADGAGVEQATGEIVSTHKARRFAECLPPSTGVLDLCCGIGGDAMALARVAELTAVDSNPVRAWMAGRNAGCATRVADVEQLESAATVFHLDPSRRRENGAASRILRYADYLPGPDYIERLLADCPDGAIKLGPGVEFEALPTGPDREIEVIAENGSLVQVVLWCGRLARHGGLRTATRLPEVSSLSAAPEPLIRNSGSDFGRYLHLVDPAIERAGLTGAACRDLPVAEAHPGLGILTSDMRVDSPWLTSHEILAQLPWRKSRVARWLSDHDGGLVTVRTRDKAVDCDVLQKQLRRSGATPYTIFGLRLGRRIVAVIVGDSPAP